MNNSVIVSLRDIVVEFDGQRILDGLNLDIHDKEFVTLLGSSGCGKTTTLRLIAGFLEPTSGKVLLKGEDITGVPPYKRPVNTVFQKYALFPHLNVFENVAFGLRLKKMDEETIRRKVRDMLEVVGLKGFERRSIGQMSGGQQQRIAIARSLLLRPEVLLLDEPFSALDAKIRQQMREELRKIQTDLNITVVFVTHDQEEAMALSDRVIVMNKGTIEQVGSPSEIYDRPTSRYVADFIGEMNFLKLQGGKTLAVRPENVHVRPGAGGELDGYVRTVMMLGHYVEMTMDTDYGIVKTFISDEESKAYHRGDPVAMTFARSHEYES